MSLLFSIDKRLLTLVICLFSLWIAGCGGGGSSSSDSDGDNDDGVAAPPASALVNAFPALRFAAPLDLQNPTGSNLLYVVERAGTIQVFVNDSTTTAFSEFLDISAQVDTNGEGGLLGLAFDPNFAANGFFYVFYTPDNNGAGRRIQVSRFTLNAGNPLVADPTSEVLVLSEPLREASSNHVGGAIAFGPLDNLLYISIGDGGSSNDPDNNGQNRATLEGAILRIDVSTTVPAGPAPNYSIPTDNPFAGNTSGFREEIFAYGLRNPFRMSFDQRDLSSQDLWAGDVGQGAREEIDVIRNGENYGWRITEGNICRPPTTGCDMTGLTAPIFDYTRDLGRSVTGGYVYRNARLPDLVGRYLFGDFASGRVWALVPNGSLTGAQRVDEIASIGGGGLAAFGRDNNGEVYLLNLFSGEILRLEPAP